MKKRLFCSFAVLCVLLCSNFALATDLSTKQNEQIELRYVKILNMSSHLNISSLGYASCSGMVTLRPGYNVEATIELLKLENGRWNSIKSWVHSGSDAEGVDVVEGYWVGRGTYMVETTAYVTDSNGKYIESPSATSVIREY